MKKPASRLLLCLAAVSGGLAGASPASGPSSSDGPEISLNVIAVFPLTTSGPGLVLPATLAEKPLPLLLDTGSRIHFLDSGLTPALGPLLSRTASRTPTGVRETPLHRLPARTFLGAVNLSGQTTGLFDLKALTWPDKNPPAGTLGLDALRHHFWNFDFDNQTLTIAQPPAVPPDIKALPEGSLINFPVELPGAQTTAFMLDTGCSADGTLEAGLFDALLQQGSLQLRTEVEIATAATASTTVRQGELSWLRFQSDTHNNLRFLRGDANRLGWTFFTRYHWQICLSLGHVSTLPRQQPQKPPAIPAARSGLTESSASAPKSTPKS